MSGYIQVYPYSPSGTLNVTHTYLGETGASLAATTSVAGALGVLGITGIFSKIAVSGQSDVDADSVTDTLTLAAGSNITITTNAATDTITIAAAGGATLGDGDYGDITVSGTGTVMTVDNDAITYAKIQNVSATDKLLGRSTAGAGDIEEITCTSFARTILDDATDSDVRTTLGLGTLATQSGTFSGTSSGTNTGDQNLFSTIAVSGQSDVVADTTSDTLTLVAGTNVTITTNAGSDSITIAASSGSASISQTEIDFGSTPLYEQEFTIVDAAVSGTSNIIASLAYVAPTGKDLDELEMDNLVISCAPGTGQFTMRVSAADGSYLADKFKINYLVG